MFCNLSVIPKQSSRVYAGLISGGAPHARSFTSVVSISTSNSLLRPASCLAVCRPGHAGAARDVQDSHNWQQYRSFRAQFPSILGQEGKLRSSCDPVLPEDCDRIVEELRYRNIKVPRQLDISWRRRIEGGFVTMYKAGRACVVFVFSIPRYINSARRMSLAEWRQVLSSTWATIKHEAHHYWVRTFIPMPT